MANSSTNCLRILQALSRNRRLVDLNLSWNNLSGAGTSVSEAQDAVEARQSAAAKYLATFIKRNRRVQHLNLENTGLTRLMVGLIASALRKARSLQSIHLSNNPFLLRGAREVIEDITHRVRAKPRACALCHGLPDKIVN